MAKYKSGLQKKVSSIFGGVPIRKDDDHQQSAGTLTPERPDYQEHPERDKELSGTPAVPQSPAPSHLTPQTPEPQPPEQAPPKETSVEQPQPEADITVATVKQVWWHQAWEQIKSKLLTSKLDASVTKQKVMVVLVPVLFIILIFVFIQVLSAPSGGTTEPQGFGTTSAAAGSGDKIDWQIPELYPTTLRNPMQFGSVATAQGQGGQLIVTGIVYSHDKPSAVIGAQIVHEGEEISGVTIVKINKNSVEFKMNNKRWTQKVQY
jgi:hypothetical protein